MTETPHFAEARSRFMRAVTAQRAACRGMSTVSSSRWRLSPNVVQRVLQDPVQLPVTDEVALADREAGLLVRQYARFAEARTARRQHHCLNGAGNWQAGLADWSTTPCLSCHSMT